MKCDEKWIEFWISLSIVRLILEIHSMESDPSTSPLLSEQRPRSNPEPFSIWQLVKKHLPNCLLTIFADIVLPLVIYFGLQKSMKPVYALLLAGSPPLAMVFCKAIFLRTFDALGFLVFIGFIISTIVAITTRNPIFLLLEKSINTVTVSVIFAITLIPYRYCFYRCRLRPLAYYFYQDLVPTTRDQLGLPEDLFSNPAYAHHEEEVLLRNGSSQNEISKVYHWLYVNCPSFRRWCCIITSIWAFGLLSEFLARLTLILIHLSVTQIVLYGNIILTLITVLCILSTVICVVQERKKTLAFVKQWIENHRTDSTTR